MRGFLAPPPGPEVQRGPAPTFSVVIAAYQAAAFIGQAVESALLQTRPPLEVLICDDGSTDGLARALEPWASEITLLRREHRGEGAAKNAAARSALGDFVAILDADDVYLPKRLEALAELAAWRPDLDILTTDAFLEVDGKPIRRCYTDDWTFEIADQRRGILQRNFIFGHAAVRRERLLAVGGFDESLESVADYDCWLRLILDGSQAGLVVEPLARYRLREAGLSSHRTHHLQAYVLVLEKAWRHPNVTVEERETLAHSLATRRRELLLAEARATLLELGPDARRRSLAVARCAELPVPTRLKAAFSAAAPKVARELLAGREREAWTAAGGIRVPRTPH